MCKRKIINIKSEKGITLTALIITIIVLLIVSTVAITNLTREKDSMISATREQSDEMMRQEAKQSIEIAAEKIKLKHINDNNFTIDNFVTELRAKLLIDDENTNVVKDTSSENVMYRVTFKTFTFSYFY